MQNAKRKITNKSKHLFVIASKAKQSLLLALRGTRTRATKQSKANINRDCGTYPERSEGSYLFLAMTDCFAFLVLIF